MNLLDEETRNWGMPLSATQLGWFETYAVELATWNARVNLTAIDDEHGIVTRHFLDSLACARFWGWPRSLVDVGSGAGFPGLPLKLLHPDLQLTLVESVIKKTAFLQHMVALLGLEGVTIITGRAEDLGRDMAHRERYDVAVARAVATLATLAEYCLPLCRLGGRFLAPKGSAIDEELQAADKALAILGGHLLAVETVSIVDLQPRCMVVVEKVATTPLAYPRRAGIPVRRPL